MAGVEGALIVGLRIAEDRGIIWPTKIMAVLSAGFLGAGVLRHYWDIYRHRTVRGISFFFVGIDAAGDLFSIVSVRKCPRRFYVRIPAELVRRLTALSSICPNTWYLGNSHLWRWVCLVDGGVCMRCILQPHTLDGTEVRWWHVVATCWDRVTAWACADSYSWQSAAKSQRAGILAPALFFNIRIQNAIGRWRGV